MADELLRRAVDVLVRLRTLSEVPAHAYDREQTSHTAEAELPVKFTASGELAPCEPSEFLFWRDRVNDSKTRDDLEFAVLGAEEALRTARKADRSVQERGTATKMRGDVIAWSRAGLTAAEIAYKADLRVKWVQWVIRTAPDENES